MTLDDARPTFRLSARDIPVPTSVSEEAQATIARLLPASATPYLEPDDVDGWRALIAATDERVRAMVGNTLSRLDDEFEVEQIDPSGFPVHVITPKGLSPEDRRVYLDIHGGAWVSGEGDVCRARGVLTAASAGAQVWAVDYRMPPDHLRAPLEQRTYVDPHLLQRRLAGPAQGQPLRRDERRRGPVPAG